MQAPTRARPLTPLPYLNTGWAARRMAARRVAILMAQHKVQGEKSALTKGRLASEARRHFPLHSLAVRAPHSSRAAESRPSIHAPSRSLHPLPRPAASKSRPFPPRIGTPFFSSTRVRGSHPKMLVPGLSRPPRGLVGAIVQVREMKG